MKCSGDDSCFIFLPWYSLSILDMSNICQIWEQNMFNSLWPSDVIWHHRSCSTLFQLMACCLTTPSYYLNQCWLLTSDLLWHSNESIITMNGQGAITYNEFQNHTFKITAASSRGQRINSSQSCDIQYIPRNMHTVTALLCFVVVKHWLIFPYPSGLLHWHCGNLTIAPVPAKQPWWIWINTSCEFIMNDCITTTKQSTTKSCAYILGLGINCICTLPYKICMLFSCGLFFLIMSNAYHL